MENFIFCAVVFEDLKIYWNWLLKYWRVWIITVQGAKRVIIKVQNSSLQKNLKGMDLTLFDISSAVFISDSLCQYYKML